MSVFSPHLKTGRDHTDLSSISDVKCWDPSNVHSHTEFPSHLCPLLLLVTWVRQQGAEKAGGLLFCVSKNLPASQKCWGESGREVCVLLGNLPLLHLLGQVEGSEKMD